MEGWAAKDAGTLHMLTLPGRVRNQELQDVEGWEAAKGNGTTTSGKSKTF